MHIGIAQTIVSETHNFKQLYKIMQVDSMYQYSAVIYYYSKCITLYYSTSLCHFTYIYVLSQSIVDHSHNTCTLYMLMVYNTVSLIGNICIFLTDKM